MLFWTIIGALSGLVVLITLRPLLRNADLDGAKDAASSDLAIYRDQLAEVDRDLDRGVLDQAEAERTRTEISRRILAADRAGTQAQAGARRPSLALAAALGLVVIGGSGGLYWSLGAPGYGDLPRAVRISESETMRASRVSQTEMEARIAELPRVSVTLTESEQALVDRLRQVVADNPDELQGWRFLANVERDLQNFDAAARAQSQVIRLTGDATTPEEYIYLLDLMVAATMGQVSPEAEQLLRSVLIADDANLPARYYLGLLYAQTDRPDIAYRLWRDVVDAGDPAEIHVQLARQQVEQAAFLAGVDYELPPERGPSAAEIAAASDMSEEDQTAMIQGMVAQLSDRLASEGGLASDWARLITAYGVLGDTDQARAIWTEASNVFATDSAAMETLRAAAERAGVAE